MDIEIRRYTEEELGCWLAFHRMISPTFKTSYAKLLIDRFQDVKEAWHAAPDDIQQRDPNITDAFIKAFIEKRNQIDPDNLITELRRTDVDAIPQADPRYPYLLRELDGAPLILFVRGKLQEMDFSTCVGVVGTRRPSAYGSKIAKEISHDLAENGAVVASGLALGIDSLSHWGAIEGGGRTIAVLAHGPDLCYPSSNKRLYQRILDGHGIGISEFFPGTKPDKWHFPARNRIISGISKAVVVVEAPTESGALITARMAVEQSHDVYCVPGRVDSPTSAGTNDLIRSGAKLVRNAQDVLDELAWVRTKYREATTVVELYGREKEIYDLLSTEPMHFDVLCEKANMKAGELSSTLTMLELAGLLERHPGDWYSRMQPSARRVMPGFPA
ncbi:MAG TPA: DNA-processing protein DprA [Candidatus Obscuribacterales bacterium]